MHTIRHEYVHVLVTYHQFKLPRWYQEGLAEFLGAMKIENDTVTIGLAPNKRIKNWRYGKLLSFNRILNDDYDIHRRSSGDAYMQYWLLVHYLLLGNPERSKQLAIYLSLWNDGVPSLEAFEQAFDITPMGLWRTELKRYLRRVVRYKRNLDLSKLDTNFSTRQDVNQEISNVLAILRESIEEH